MDKILSEMERQRRAESIYYTRRNNNYDYEDDKKGNNIYKRLFLHLSEETLDGILHEAADGHRTYSTWHRSDH